MIIILILSILARRHLLTSVLKTYLCHVLFCVAKSLQEISGTNSSTREQYSKMPLEECIPSTPRNSQRIPYCHTSKRDYIQLKWTLYFITSTVLKILILSSISTSSLCSLHSFLPVQAPSHVTFLFIFSLHFFCFHTSSVNLALVHSFLKFFWYLLQFFRHFPCVSTQFSKFLRS